MHTLNLRPTTSSPTRIPVYIISGFLGSGKTTLLNRLLSQAPKSAVIINEFGTVPIDQNLLRAHHLPITTLAGGCLCCQVIGSLTPLLKNLRMAWESGQQDFDRIIIETSGVANPEPVLDIILRERWLAKRLSLQGVITTVSAANGNLNTYPIAQAQLAWADSIVITHSDVASPAQMTTLNQHIRQFAPTAQKITAVQGECDLATLLNVPKPFRPMPAHTITAMPEHQFESISLQLTGAIPWETLKPVLEGLISSYAGQLVRLKAVVYTPGQDQPLLIQASAGILYAPIRLQARPTDDGIGRLVIISSVNSQQIAETLSAGIKTNNIFTNLIR